MSNRKELYDNIISFCIKNTVDYNICRFLFIEDNDETFKDIEYFIDEMIRYNKDNQLPLLLNNYEKKLHMIAVDSYGRSVVELSVASLMNRHKYHYLFQRLSVNGTIREQLNNISAEEELKELVDFLDNTKGSSSKTEGNKNSCFL